MKKKSVFLILSGILVLVLLAYLFQVIQVREKKGAAEELSGEKAVSMDYDKLAQVLKVNREEEYYPCYVDYLCYLKNKYPNQAKLTDIIEDHPDYSSIRVWKGNGYTLKALWPLDIAQDGFELEWTWDNKELQDKIEGLIEAGMKKLDSGSENIDRIVSGNLYELTDNEFQPGIDYDLNEDEIKQIQELMKKDNVLKEENHKTAETRYILVFYDANEGERMSLGVSSDGKIYTDDGALVLDNDLQTLVASMIKREKK